MVTFRLEWVVTFPSEQVVTFRPESVVTFERNTHSTGSEMSPTPASTSPENGLVTRCWIDRATVEHGSPFRLWVLFDNRSDGAALNLHFLSFQTPGLQGKSCWTAEGPMCHPQGPGLHPRVGLPADLQKGQSLALFGVLETGERLSQVAASGVFTWRDTRGLEHEGAVVLAPVPVVSWSGRLNLVLKELLLPAALALFGWFLQRLDSQREKREKVAAEALAQREKLAAEQLERKERERSRRRETWNLMLPKSHANAEQHYMPIVAELEQLHLSLLEDDAKKDWDFVLWHLLRFMRRMRHLAHDIGGFYFSSRDGERQAAQCWKRFYIHAHEQLGRSDLQGAIDAIDRNIPLPTFRAMFENRAELGTLRQNLQKWVSTGDTGIKWDLALLDLLAAVIRYEMNRTYELWYGEVTQFDEKEFSDPLKLLALAPELEEFRQGLEAYEEKLVKRKQLWEKGLKEGGEDPMTFLANLQ